MERSPNPFRIWMILVRRFVCYLSTVQLMACCLCPARSRLQTSCSWMETILLEMPTSFVTPLQFCWSISSLIVGNQTLRSNAPAAICVVMTVTQLATTLIGMLILIQSGSTASTELCTPLVRSFCPQKKSLKESKSLLIHCKLYLCTNYASNLEYHVFFG